MEVTFIGGPLDGLTKDIQGCRIYHVPIPQPAPSPEWVESKAELIKDPIPTHDYRIHNIDRQYVGFAGSFEVLVVHLFMGYLHLKRLAA